MKKCNEKISRGYRLKRSTHEMIKRLIFITQENSDSVISRSCEIYYKEISAGKNDNQQNGRENN